MKRLEEMRDQCAAYHKQHPEVWDMFVRFTFEMINRGFKNYSANGLVRVEVHIKPEFRTLLRAYVKGMK